MPENSRSQRQYWASDRDIAQEALHESRTAATRLDSHDKRLSALEQAWDKIKSWSVWAAILFMAALNLGPEKTIDVALHLLGLKK